MALYLNDIAAQWLAKEPDTQRSKLVQNDILPLIGHYKVSGFDQFLLEDARQRFSRRGVSLETFRTEYLPALQELLGLAVQNRVVDSMPSFFHYQLGPVLLTEISDSWLAAIESKITAASYRRYYNILSKKMIPQIGTADLRFWDADALERYREQYLSQGGAQSSFSFHITILYGVLDYAVGEAIKQNGCFVPKPHILRLKDVAQEWIAEQKDSNAARDARTALDMYLLPMIGLSDIRNLSQRRLEQYGWMLARRGCGSDVLKKHIKILNAIRTYAVKTGKMESAPKLQGPQRRRSVQEHLPDESQLYAVIRSDSALADVLIIRLTWQLGLQMDELRTLRWSQLNLEHGIAEISGRQIPIPPDLVEYLKPRAYGQPRDSYVVQGCRKHGPISEPAVFQLARTLLKRFGIEKTRLVDLRRDYAIRALRTMPPEEAAKLCGFQSVGDFLLHYADFLPKDAVET